MKDAARPSDDEFNRVLQQSLKTWSFYLNTGSEGHLLPLEAIDFKPLLRHTPPFLGHDLTSSDDKISFSCEEKTYPGVDHRGPLLINARSTWRTSKGVCDLPPRALENQLLKLAVEERRNIRFSDESLFSDWPGVQGLPSYDKGNYLAVLYLAWAYILSARWVELVDRCAGHECHMEYIEQDVPSSPQSAEEAVPVFEVDLGNDVGEEEALWWHNILRSDDGWKATTTYNGHVYFAPWWVSTKNSGLAFRTATGINLKDSGAAKTLAEPPSSAIALKYLTRFCVYHRLYAQCSVALAGIMQVSVPARREVTLPFPKSAPRVEVNELVDEASASIPDLIAEHEELLPKYITLSSNPWGIRTLLHCTFFNPDIECNLVSAWLNPAFAILKSISPDFQSDSMANFLVNRSSRLGILWLGTMFTGLARPILRDIRSGMSPLDLAVSGWTETPHTFLTSKMGDTRGDSIRRDDECRLLFITAHEYHARPPIWNWKPFGSTKVCDTEISVQQHAQCTDHCFEYESWEWILTDGSSIRDYGDNNSFPHSARNETPSLTTLSSMSLCEDSVNLDGYDYDFHSESLSEGHTRGIFMWLRMTGYPSSEKELYQHSWIDLGESEEEVCDDAESELGKRQSENEAKVEHWVENIEQYLLYR